MKSSQTKETSFADMLKRKLMEEGTDFVLFVDICRKANELSLSKWTGDIELDTAIVFEKMGCGLPCYEKQEFDSELCNYGKDCIGLFKIQKGFSGFVPDIGLEVKDIYPILIIWDIEK